MSWRPTTYAWLSIGTALVTMAIKSVAYWLTGSVGLLSDAIESCVNLLAALVAFFALRIAAVPPDAGHEFGHDKAEYFSGGFEGALIVVAALAILATAVSRLVNPQPLEPLGPGMIAAIIAAAVNFVVARILQRGARRHHSIALEADGHHLMTDVWTTVGVVVGLVLVHFTGWLALDSLLAMGVAGSILYTGSRLVQRSGAGLLDAAIPPDEHRVVESILLATTAEAGGSFGALRTRRAGARRFVEATVHVPGEWSVDRAHALCDAIESALAAGLPNTTAVLHVEPRRAHSTNG
jgi:cation diffusion facilitator family transporter